MVTAWSWIEKNEEVPVLVEEIGAMVVSFATVDNPMYLWSVQNVLPVKLSAVVNGETVELTLTGWSCEDYPTAGAYQGTYTFTTTLPEGYVLGEDAPALEIPVIFMGGISQMNLEAQTKSNVSYIGQNETPETCETATVVTSTDEAWSEGWYVVSGEIEIEKITVTSDGPVNLILEKDSSLKVKGLTVNSDAELAIYGQAKDSGTMTILGGMNLLSEEISVVSGAVCAEITLDRSITNSGNITIPNKLSVELDLGTNQIEFQSGYGFALGEGSKLALWSNNRNTLHFPNGITLPNAYLNDVLKDGYDYFNEYGKDTYPEADVARLYGASGVGPHAHNWKYTTSDAKTHNATCRSTKCGQTTVQPHDLRTIYYSGTQHRVYCRNYCGYEAQFSDHVYDEATGECTCGAKPVSYRDTNGNIHTVGCMDFREIAEEVKGDKLATFGSDPYWFVLQGTDPCPGVSMIGPSYNLILADGCDVTVSGGLFVSSMTIWGQEQGNGKLTVTGGDIPAIDFVSLTINGGTVVASGARAFSGVPKMASGMMAYVVNGDTEVPVSRATAADVLNGASKVKVTACTQSHDASAEAAYAYVDGSTHRPVCPYCAASLGEDQPHSFGDSGSCACGAVRAVYYDENGMEKTITQCTILTEKMNRLSDGWYLVTGTLNLEEGLYIEGDVKLILADGAQLIANPGIWDGYGSDWTLTIYGQENGTGILRATSGSSYGAAIGVNNVVINGGSVYAENSDKGFSSSTVQVNRGNVEVTVGEGKYAFGGSLTASSAATIRINAGANLCHSSVSGSFIFFQGSEGTVRGAVERTSVPMGAGESLLVPEGSTLTLGTKTFTGPVCLKISDTPTVFASSLRQRAAATFLTEENAEAYYPLVYTDTSIIISGLDETNSFTRSDVTGCLVKVGTTVKLSCQEPLGKLFECFNCGDDLPLNADNSFTMPERKVTVTAEYTDAPLAVQYTDNGVPAYRNFTEADVKAAFEFAMSKEQATVLLFQDVHMGDGIELTGGSITLKSSGETPWPFIGKIDLKGGQLTVESVNILGIVTVVSGKLHVTGGYIIDLTVESEDLSDVVLSGGSFGCVSISKYRPVFFVLEVGKALADENNDLVSLNGFYLQSVHVVDHTHSWTYSEPTAESHVQTCAACGTTVTAPHQAGENDKCGCGMYVVSYVNYLGEPQTAKGCIAVSDTTTELTEGWYVVQKSVLASMASNNLTVSGNVNLILTEGTIAYWNMIEISSGSLTVWSQSTIWTEGAGVLSTDQISGQGKLVLNSGTIQVISGDTPITCAVEANGGRLSAHSTAENGIAISGSFSTASDGCALIQARPKIQDETNKASWSGIIYTNNIDNESLYTVYGKQTLNQTLPAVYWLHVPQGAELNYDNGFAGVVYVDGTFNGSYDHTYYRLTYPQGTTITEDGAITLNGGTYYKKNTKSPSGISRKDNGC